MESVEVKAEDEVLMSKDEEVFVESHGEIDALKYEKSVPDCSISENLKVRKRGRSGDNHDKNKDQGCGESNGLGMKTGESDGGIETYKRRGRIKKEKGSENGQEDVDMRKSNCDLRGREKSKDFVQENGGTASAVEEGKVMDEDKDSLGDVLKEKCVSPSAAEGNGGKDLGEEDIRGEKEKGNESEKEKSNAELQGRRSKVRKSKAMAIEKMGLNIELNIDDEDEGVSNRGKKGGRGKRNINGTSLKRIDVGAQIFQMEGKKTVEERNLRSKGKGQGEGKELNETVTTARVGLKRDENVGRIWEFL